MKKVQLNEVCVPDGIQTGPFGSQLHQSDYSEEGIPVIMPVNLIDGGISEQNIARVSEDHVDRLSKYKVAEGDIVYARRGDVGRCSRVTKNESGWLCGTGCLRITPDNKAIDGQYLFYLLSLPSVVGWVRNNAKGTTMPNLNTEILSSIPLNIEPDVSKQKKLAGVLSVYDSLIENNRKQIKLLEEAAQRLYKEWFIDLRFPGHETASIDSVTGLPEEWSYCPFLDVVGYVRGRSYSADDLVDSANRDLVNLNNIAPFGGWQNGAEKPYSGTYNAEQVVQGGDLVMAVTDMTKERRLVGHVGVVPRLSSGSIISMDLIKLVAEELVPNFLYGQLRYSGIASMISMLANGTNVLHLKPESLNRVQLLCPSEKVQESYSEVIESILSSIDCLNERIALLAEVRNRLLPKLMEGGND